MNTTHIRTLRRMATALGLAALSAAATLSLGVGTATADRAVCECADGKHTPHSTVPGLRDDFNPQPEPPGREHHSFLITGRFPGLTTNHSLTTARTRRGDH